MWKKPFTRACIQFVFGWRIQKSSLQADKLEELAAYKTLNNYFRESGGSTSPANTFCSFSGFSRVFGWMLSFFFHSLIALSQILLSTYWLCFLVMLRTEEQRSMSDLHAIQLSFQSSLLESPIRTFHIFFSTFLLDFVHLTFVIRFHQYLH